MADNLKQRVEKALAELDDFSGEWATLTRELLDREAKLVEILKECLKDYNEVYEILRIKKLFQPKATVGTTNISLEKAGLRIKDIKNS